MALDQDEFKFPDEVVVGSDSTDNEVKIDIELENEDVDIEIVDDTPQADRDRKPLPKELVADLEKDEAEEYSQRVKERMSQLKKVWHDERREKEAAAREREEAIKYAQRLMDENKRLKSSLNTGEKSYVQVAKQVAEQEMELASRSYREAYDMGDTDKIIDAQKKLNEAQYKLAQVQNYVPQYENALQEQQNEVYIPQQQSQAPRPDAKALAWQDQNEWFGSDEEMTSLALGLHEKLVRSGVSPSSEEYYRRIDDTMRKRFPEFFRSSTLDEEQPAQRTKPSTVVASATRSTAPKKVQISKSAQVIAKKLGISPEQYAKELVKLESKNG